MEQYFSSHTVALIISTAIFILSATLIARQLVNFLFTCVLLFFATASGVAIANNEIVRSYFTVDSSLEESVESGRMQRVKERIEEIFQQLVEILSNRKAGDEQKGELKSSVEHLVQQLEEQKAILQAFLENKQLEEQEQLQQVAL